MTALSFAAKRGHLDIVQYLVDKCEANINHQDKVCQYCYFYSKHGYHLLCVSRIAWFKCSHVGSTGGPHVGS